MAETSKVAKLLGIAAKFIPEAPWVAIVVELVSHLTSAMGVTSSDGKETLRHVEGLREDVQQIAAAHVALGMKLDEQTARLDTQMTAIAVQTKKFDALNGELEAAHITAEGLRTRMEKIERRATLMGLVGIALLVVVCALTIVLVVHLRR